MGDSRSKAPAFWEPDAKWFAKHEGAVRAIQAVWGGVANEGQQKSALMYILNELCCRHGNQYYPEQRDTDFALGKKFIADQVVSAINAPLGKIEETKNVGRNTRKPGSKRR